MQVIKDLEITIVQTNLIWEDSDANLESFTQKLQKIEPASTDLIALPEMFNTGFTMNAVGVAETMNGKTMEWLAKTAEGKKCVVTGSLVIKENKKYFNRLIWMYPDGTFEFYDKRHLFRMADEDKTYTAGKEKLIVELNGWKICPLICYDLRFPVWSRQPPAPEGGGNKDRFDCLIYVANWPDRRIYAWRQLLMARAIENQCYVVGVNRIGKDGKEIDYSGYSVVLNPKGEPLSNINPTKEYIGTTTLPYKDLENYRKEFPVSLDSDKFTITNN